jgi:hypothetical protein
MGRPLIERRHHERFRLETRITVCIGNSIRILGRTLDISRAGLSAIVLADLEVGQVVELSIALPFESCPIAMFAIVRNRNTFRYGFEFTGTDTTIRARLKSALS